MKNFDADCIYIVTVKKFEEDDYENVEVLFECAYGTREKAHEAYHRAEAMFTQCSYVEFGVRRVVIVQGDGCPEEEMAYERLQELANEEFELYWGPRCEEYEEGCPTCDAYAARDARDGEKK
jgi:hypothetical protein